MDRIAKDAKRLTRGKFSEAISIVYISESGDTDIPTRGIFDRSFQRFLTEDGNAHTNRETFVTIYDGDLGVDVGGNEDLNWRVQARGLTFRVKEVEPDGTGAKLLRLRKLDSSSGSGS